MADRETNELEPNKMAALGLTHAVLLQNETKGAKDISIILKWTGSNRVK